MITRLALRLRKAVALSRSHHLHTKPPKRGVHIQNVRSINDHATGKAVGLIAKTGNDQRNGETHAAYAKRTQQELGHLIGNIIGQPIQKPTPALKEKALPANQPEIRVLITKVNQARIDPTYDTNAPASTNQADKIGTTGHVAGLLGILKANGLKFQPDTATSRRRPGFDSPDKVIDDILVTAKDSHYLKAAPEFIAVMNAKLMGADADEVRKRLAKMKGTEGVFNLANDACPQGYTQVMTGQPAPMHTSPQTAASQVMLHHINVNAPHLKDEAIKAMTESGFNTRADKVQKNAEKPNVAPQDAENEPSHTPRPS